MFCFGVHDIIYILPISLTFVRLLNMGNHLIKLILLSLIIQCIIINTTCYKFLILHPIYSGSHVLTVHQVSRELVKRGHHVVTIRYKDTHDLKLNNPHEWNLNAEKGFVEENNSINMRNSGSFREIQRTLNNSDGNIPYVTMEEEAKFVIPSELLWSEGTTLWTLFKLPKNPWDVLKGGKSCKLISHFN